MGDADMNIGGVLPGVEVGTDQGALVIPDDDPDGITGLINVQEDLESIQRLTVQVRIDHGDLSHLRMTLESPTGTEVVLHEGGAGENINTRYGRATPLHQGRMDDFWGESPNGVWRLRVSDTLAETSGELVSWALHFNENYTEGDVFVGNTLDVDGRIRSRSGLTITMGGDLVMEDVAGNPLISLNPDGIQMGAEQSLEISGGGTHLAVGGAIKPKLVYELPSLEAGQLTGSVESVTMEPDRFSVNFNRNTGSVAWLKVDLGRVFVSSGFSYQRYTYVQRNVGGQFYCELLMGEGPNGPWQALEHEGIAARWSRVREQRAGRYFAIRAEVVGGNFGFDAATASCTFDNLNPRFRLP